MIRASFSSSYTKFSTNSVNHHSVNHHSVNHQGWAWVSLCLALAVHVFDERLMPGVYSAPMLLMGSIYLLWSVRQD